MTKYEIYIFITRKTSYSIGNLQNTIPIVVTTEKYDKLSQRFTMYKHIMEYKPGKYDPSEYLFYIYDKNGWFPWTRYRFTYYNPQIKVSSIDMYFAKSDTNNTTPLILGFNEVGENEPKYFTYNYLIGQKKLYNHFPRPQRHFTEIDLIARLTEELSLYLNDYRRDKLIIKSDLRPTSDPITYPLSGPNDKRITVSKIFEEEIPYFDKYTHKINKPDDDSGFYISYKKDSIYIELNDNKYKKLNYFNVYYNTFDDSAPLIFGLRFNTGSKLFKYSDFNKYLKELKLTIQVKDLPDLDDSKLYDVLKTENDTVNDYITYSTEKKLEYTYQIKVSLNQDFKGGSGFQNYTHKPLDKYIDKKSQLVFQGKKLLRRRSVSTFAELYDIDDLILTSVDVYFGPKKPDFPLIVKLTKKGRHSNNPDFFAHKRSYNGYYWERLYFESGRITDEILLSKLRKTEFDLTESIVLLMDKKDARYGYREILRAVVKADASKETILAEVDVNSIKTYDRTETLGKCIRDKGYRVVEQDLSSSVNPEVNRGLRFYTLSSRSGEYRELALYNNERDPSEVNEEYIYYNSKDNNSVYVYFYHSDHRPLMVCYGENVFRPYSLDYYEEKWVRVTGVSKCVCNDVGEKDRFDSQLLAALTQAAKTLGLISEQKVPEVPKIPSVDIDLSKNKTLVYGPSNMTVSRVYYYDESDLYCYFTHSLKDNSSFTISSLITENSKNKITNITEVFSMVRSVNVYFNRYNLYNPVMLSITPEDGKTMYYKSLVQNASTYPFSNLKKVEEADLTDELINESDEVNKSLTYQLDKTTKKNDKYGRSNLINLTKQEFENYGFTIYNHVPLRVESYKGFVLFNKKILIGWSEHEKIFLKIQNKEYKGVNVYVLNSNLNLPLLLEFIETSSSSYYIKKSNDKGEYWLNVSLSAVNNDLIRLKLIEISYPLKNSVIVEIDKKHSSTKEKLKYGMRMISNKRTSGGQYEEIQYENSKPIDSKNVEVSHISNITDLLKGGQSLFFYVTHDLKELTNNLINSKEIAGVRFFMSNIDNTQPQEIYFYEKERDYKNSRSPLFFYYPPINSASKKIFVYFYDDDPRPLLVSYGDYTYKRLHRDDHTKWVRAGNAHYTDFSEELKILNDIYGTMDKKITLVKDGEIDHNIKVTKDQDVGSFKKDSYTIRLGDKKEDASLKLPITELVQGLENDTSLDKLLADLYRQPFSSINVYKTEKSLSLNSILLFEFVNDAGKTHISKKDQDGKYWERKKLPDEISVKVLSGIQSETFGTVIYEISSRESYSERITFKPEDNVPEKGFTKYTHSPKNGGAKTTTILFEGENLRERYGESYKPISSLKNYIYDRVIVYFSSKTNKEKKNFPLLIVLHRNKSSSPIFYKHKRQDKEQYWERLNIEPRGQDELIFRLKETEFELADTMVILMSQTSYTYGDEKIKQAILDLNESKHINLAGIDKDSIPVKKVYSDSCISGHGFTVYEHEIGRIKERSYLALRFFMYTSDKNQYMDLSLYSDDKEFEEFLYYDEDHNKAYIYFYGLDPRPILFRYGTTGYKPSSTYYDSNWQKIKDKIDFECYSSNNKLLKELSNVVGLLNIVKLETLPENISQNENSNVSRTKVAIYYLQYYNGQGIYITLGYENKSCYRCYTHTPMGSGYRLGNISYHGRRDIGLGYDLTKQLQSVSVYYNVFDISHQYPLLVVLGFEEGFNEYYRLKEKTSNSWTKLRETEDQEILDKLGDLGQDKTEEALNLLENKLKITYDSEDYKIYLFKTEKCAEESSNKSAIVGGSLGGVLTTAAGGGGAALATHPEWLHPVIRALT